MIDQESIFEMKRDVDLQLRAESVFNDMCKYKYSYHFTWMGRPIIQFPQDILAMQELIWSVKPDLIIETGIAHGGSLIFSASMMALLDMYCPIMSDDKNQGNQESRVVLGIDIDIRSHNRVAIEEHPLYSKIEMIEGSSVSESVIQKVYDISKKYEKIMVCLDSNHTHDHVLSELHAYTPLVSRGSYCVVFDTVVENMPKEMFPNRPWGPGNNPKTAVLEFIKNQEDFVIDNSIDDKLMLTVAPSGFLKRVS